MRHEWTSLYQKGFSAFKCSLSPLSSGFLLLFQLLGDSRNKVAWFYTQFVSLWLSLTNPGNRFLLCSHRLATLHQHFCIYVFNSFSVCCLSIFNFSFELFSSVRLKPLFCVTCVLCIAFCSQELCLILAPLDWLLFWKSTFKGFLALADELASLKPKGSIKKSCKKLHVLIYSSRLGRLFLVIFMSLLLWSLTEEAVEAAVRVSWNVLRWRC